MITDNSRVTLYLHITGSVIHLYNLEQCERVWFFLVKASKQAALSPLHLFGLILAYFCEDRVCMWKQTERIRERDEHQHDMHCLATALSTSERRPRIYFTVLFLMQIVHTSGMHTYTEILAIPITLDICNSKA